MYRCSINYKHYGGKKPPLPRAFVLYESHDEIRRSRLSCTQILLTAIDYDIVRHILNYHLDDAESIICSSDGKVVRFNLPEQRLDAERFLERHMDYIYDELNACMLKLESR